jgi:hypothetical protein
LLQEIIEAKGHKVVFYPKFHCELNYIEMYWGAAKRSIADIRFITCDKIFFML